MIEPVAPIEIASQVGRHDTCIIYAHGTACLTLRHVISGVKAEE